MGSPAGVSASATSLTPGVLALITPSPGASPVSVTKQSQIVTTYVPQFTLCALPPIEFFSVSPVPSARPTTAPYQNYSISIPPGNGTCTTIYSQTETMVCDTTLTDLVTTYPVTNCAQEITFSSQYGYQLVTPTAVSNISSNATYPSPNGTFPNATGIIGTAIITPAPTIETLTTFYLAPWQQLTAATAPSDVIKKICQTFDNDTEECITEYQVWHTSLVTKTATSTLSLNISTTIFGPSQIIVMETYVANVTELVTTFSMSTTLETEYQTEYTTTHHSPASVSTAPTVYETMTVQQASSTSDSTSTTTIRRTSTIFVGTTTVTAPTATGSAASA
ncbi:hypothetical protein LTR36_005602 [Oleoguttula mirabilis]|uniref:Uncharacterized protein n=1 Tax=Oleoguttula mirabilis TaxID=1507867 RepID=A0AAV9JEB1_9PEZI|nr:hypothetical protein LTR36_005602 [Oleoguttula mirabilis]